MDVSTKDKDGNSFEEVTSFCQVDDIYTFENMGFSHTVDNKKYLACPECELGPLGFHDLLTKKSFLSMDRVVDETTLNQTQDTAAFWQKESKKINLFILSNAVSRFLG